MVKVYDIHHIQEGIEIITNPLYSSCEQLKELEQRKDQVILETAFLTPKKLASVYSLGEQTGIPVLQREYTLKSCPFDGTFNFNDGEYIGDKLGFEEHLSYIIEILMRGTQAEIDSHSLL